MYKFRKLISLLMILFISSSVAALCQYEVNAASIEGEADEVVRDEEYGLWVNHIWYGSSEDWYDADVNSDGVACYTNVSQIRWNDSGEWEGESIYYNGEQIGWSNGYYDGPGLLILPNSFDGSFDTSGFNALESDDLSLIGGCLPAGEYKVELSRSVYHSDFTTYTTYRMTCVVYNTYSNYVYEDRDSDGVNETLVISGDIASDQFADNTEITTVILENGVSEIPSRAFEGCTNLSEVTIPDSVTVVANDAFQNCSSLRAISVKCDAFGRLSAFYSVLPSDTKVIEVHTRTNGNDSVCSTCGNNIACQWRYKSGYYCYYIDDIKQTGWLEIDGNQYYFDSDGIMKTSWQQINGNWYYFDANGVMYSGWLYSGGRWYYLSDSGSMSTGWKKVDNVWYYFSGSGSMVTGWKKVGLDWYYFNGSGVMQTGWQRLGGTWYYFEASGRMVSGWKKINDLWYYFEAGGNMVSGWKKINTKWYYFNAGGAMKTGWQIIDGKNYYFDANGAMATGWQKINGNWRYFYAGGELAINTVIDGYTIGSNGIWIR